MSMPRTPIEEAEVLLLSFVTLALDGGQLSSSPIQITPEKEQWRPLNRRVGGPQRHFRRFGEEENNLPLGGFEPWILRSVA